MTAPAARRLRRLAPWLGVMAMLAPALGHAAEGDVPRPLQMAVVPQPKKPKPAPKAVATPAPAYSPLPGGDALASALDPDLSGPARIGGWTAPPGGGADCRTSCAENRYMCRADQDQQDCDSAWSQCVAACPMTSGSF